MKKKRMPLEKRLAGTGAENCWPHAAWIYVEDYFLCLSDINQDLSNLLVKIFYDKGLSVNFSANFLP